MFITEHNQSSDIFSIRQVVMVSQNLFVVLQKVI